MRIVVTLPTHRPEELVLCHGTACTRHQEGVKHHAWRLNSIDLSRGPELVRARRLENNRSPDSVRELARSVSGRFRTNTVPVEAINVSLWRASSRWKNRDPQGYAQRANISGGDWQIFPPDGPQDGYGNW